MAKMLDLVSGGSFLPHVYCKKVTLQNGPEENQIEVVLNLEFFRDATSAQSFANNNQNFQEYLYLQVVPFAENRNIKKLMPQNAYKNGQRQLNIFTAFNDPSVEEWYAADSSRQTYLPIGQISGHSRPEQRLGSIFKQFEFTHKAPIDPPMSIKNLLNGPASRQEVVSGKPYDVVALQYKYIYNIPSNSPSHLGFMFYCFLDVPSYILDTYSGEYPVDLKILNGPVNTQIVLRNGQIPSEIHQFYTTVGKKWNGSVHLHTEDNPDLSDPNSPYFGDGSSGENKGWMAGEIHTPNKNQPKLNLFYIPNFKVQDFRSKTTLPQENVLGLNFIDGSRVLNMTDLTESELLLEQLAGKWLMPFQKEARKYVSKIDFVSAQNALNMPIQPNLYDNDSEYSKLYLSKDAAGNTQGVFMINFLSLLKNNSNIFSRLSNTPTVLDNILNSSELIDLKVYRDRVVKKPIGLKYEKYLNDESYEEPGILVASRKEGTLVSKILFGENNSLNNKILQSFSFNDADISRQASGAYQYRIEVMYKDGTYSYIKSRLNDLKNVYSRLQEYYQFSLSSFVVEENNQFFSNSSYGGASYNSIELGYKNNFIPYYKDGVFNGQFYLDALERFPDEPWGLGTNNSLTAAKIFQEITVMFNVASPEADNMRKEMIKMLSPGESGSPQGIDASLKIIKSFIDNIERILGAPKKRGSEYARQETVSTVELGGAPAISSPSTSLIEEYYTFDHPSEIVRAAQNKNIYIDYISTGDAKIADNNNLMILSVEELINRCRLELTEISPDLNSEEQINNATNLNDSLYSFLSPSILSLTSENLISKFRQDGVFSDQESLSNNITNVNYEQFLNALINYNNSKVISEDYDSMSNYNIVKDINGNDVASTMPTMLDESYKEIIDYLNITVHNENLHDSFFKKQSGAISVEINPAPQSGDLLPKTINAFSDSSLGSGIKDHVHKLLFSDDSLINTPSQTHPVNYISDDMPPSNIPNIHKIALQVRDPAGLSYSTNELFTESATEQNTNSYAFLNYNFVARIEILDVLSIDLLKPLKDQNNWRLLTLSDLNDIVPTQSYICRMRLYDESFVEGLTMPIINNIFFISNGNFNTISYDNIQPMNYFTPINEQQNLRQIVAELRNESVEIVTASKNKIGKSLLSGTSTSQTSGVNQQTVTQASPLQSTQPLTEAQPVSTPTTTSPNSGFSGPSGDGFSVGLGAGPSGGYQ